MKTWKAIMHFNKPGSRRKEESKRTPWTVHWRGTCYQVKEIQCNVPMVSEWKPNKKDNPRAFFTARVNKLTVNKKGIATLE